jgi:hypothetical protein
LNNYSIFTFNRILFRKKKEGFSNESFKISFIFFYFFIKFFNQGCK